MAKIIVVLKAILTRIIFGTHGLIAIWRVTAMKNDPYYWYLCGSILALAFEGIFTLTIKKNQEWKWFCPSVFFYLCSVVPAIWLIEVDKFDKKLANITALAEMPITTTLAPPPCINGIAPKALKANASVPNPNGKIANTTNRELEDNSTTILLPGDIPGLDTLGVKIPAVKLDETMWITVIEQFLMLILIIGRWMLPKGGLTRDQLSQLLLVYIGTAADIIEFFDSFKDDKISQHRILCLLILAIWSWSLLQFTFVLTATKARRTRLTTDVKEPPKLKIVNGIIKVKEVCCTIDVWAILINIILQDAPFLIFRALLIFYFKIISYMNIFFTCKNTLVIILQFYRLYVVQQEKNKELSKMAKATVSKNVANAVERAARMGPNSEGKGKLVKGSSSNRRSGPSSRQVHHKTKHRSQDSISSQNTNRTDRSSSRRERVVVERVERSGRRRSLSAGNLSEVGEGETFEDRIREDEIELGMSGSAISEINDPDSQDEEESEPPLDEVSIASERPKGIRKNIRMSENPGIYKISGSRSSGGSSERGHGRYRQDTGYSSSSKDSGNSGGQRGRAQSSGGRSSGRNVSGSRSRSTAQRRRQFISSKYCSSIEFGELGGILAPIGGSLQQESLADNERLWQRRSGIGVVFFLFFVIFILCMVAIYGGINPKGLVLRENFRIRKTTRPTTTTTPAPTTAIVITRKPIVVFPGPVETSTSNGMEDLFASNTTSILNETSADVVSGYNNNSDSFNISDGRDSTITNSDVTVDNMALLTTEDSLRDFSSLNNLEDENIDLKESDSELKLTKSVAKNENKDTTLSAEILSEDITQNSIGSYPWRSINKESSDRKIFRTMDGLTNYHHNLRHRMSRIFKFISDSSNFYKTRGRFHTV